MDRGSLKNRLKRLEAQVPKEQEVSIQDYLDAERRTSQRAIRKIEEALLEHGVLTPEELAKRRERTGSPSPDEEGQEEQDEAVIQAWRKAQGYEDPSPEDRERARKDLLARIDRLADAQHRISREEALE